MKQPLPASDIFAGAIEMMADPLSHMKQHSYEAPVGGTKFDQGKIDLTLVPLIAIECEARALMFGEEKYGRYNYTQGFDSSRLTAAALRHLYQFISGQDADNESGIHHLGHVRACLAMYLHCEQLGTIRDNRFRGGR